MCVFVFLQLGKVLVAGRVVTISAPVLNSVAVVLRSEPQRQSMKG